MRDKVSHSSMDNRKLSQSAELWGNRNLFPEFASMFETVRATITNTKHLILISPFGSSVRCAMFCFVSHIGNTQSNMILS